MLYASDIIGKQVISLYECEPVGTISNIYLNKKRSKITFYEMINTNNDKNFFTPNNIYCVGDAFVIKTTSNLSTTDEIDFSTITDLSINKQIFTTNGKFVGIVKDVALKNFCEPQNLIITKNTDLVKEYNDITQNESPTVCEQETLDILITTLKFSDILRYGKILLMQEGDKKIKFSNLKPSINLNNKLINQKVYALNNINTNELSYNNQILNSSDKVSTNSSMLINYTGSETPLNLEAINKKIAPTPILSKNYNFLLGRKAEKNIFASNKELIIKKNSKITDQHIEIASIYNKLRDLAIFSK